MNLPSSPEILLPAPPYPAPSAMDGPGPPGVEVAVAPKFGIEPILFAR